MDHIKTCGSPHFRLDFDMDNAAFEDDPRRLIVTILDRVALLVLDHYREGAILDVNGNTIGSWRIS